MKLILSSDQTKFFQPSAHLIQLSFSERLKVSLKKFVLFFVLAVVSFLIPVLHFFLVPLFLLLSILFAVKAYSAVYRLKLQDACICIHCQAPIKSEILLGENLRFKCDKCFVHYIVHR
ncbi:MAG: hypothetical protein ACXWC9_01785 [Pseudobdellovibrionaceae bacterium]